MKELFLVKTYHYPSGCDGADFELETHVIAADNIDLAIPEAVRRGFTGYSNDDDCCHGELVDDCSCGDCCCDDRNPLKGFEVTSQSDDQVILDYEGDFDSYGNNGEIVITKIDYDLLLSKLNDVLSNQDDDKRLAIARLLHGLNAVDSRFD